VWAVGGTSSDALIEHWNGTRWSIIPGQGAGELTALSVLSSTDVWAVGSTGKTLVERWNGTKWSIIPSPNPGAFGNGLGGVTAITSTNVWAVGLDYTTRFGFQTLAEHWDGKKWRVVQTPNFGPYPDELRSVSAVSANDVWAVGYRYIAPGNISLTLAEHWDGTQWNFVATPSPTGDDILQGVVALSAQDVWAVGGYSSAGQNLVEQWNGTSWNTVPSPFRHGTISSFWMVSADSAADIWAVGFQINTQNFTYQTLIEHDC
jgi:hypothetical protein